VLEHLLSPHCVPFNHQSNVMAVVASVRSHQKLVVNLKALEKLERGSVLDM